MNIRQHDVRLFRPLNGTNLLLHATVMQAVQVPPGRRPAALSDVVNYLKQNMPEVNSSKVFVAKEHHR